jgi:hypothetical protein
LWAPEDSRVFAEKKEILDPWVSLVKLDVMEKEDIQDYLHLKASKVNPVYL